MMPQVWEVDDLRASGIHVSGCSCTQHIMRHMAEGIQMHGGFPSLGKLATFEIFAIHPLVAEESAVRLVQTELCCKSGHAIDLAAACHPDLIVKLGRLKIRNLIFH